MSEGEAEARRWFSSEAAVTPSSRWRRAVPRVMSVLAVEVRPAVPRRRSTTEIARSLVICPEEQGVA
ncbi:hypothetical protein OV079_48180 [Nannocystis pusilla]|uniref:Uncharacterized protein n=1 Tax=Nannocystis pusilla TaxID=889268 RepID=A0A9X3J3T9_9BACT|nr:hypothetical protein [Nannocystis pusilla]MCY1013184.1 hypothetical protein [Nannocystis pusilla]